MKTTKVYEMTRTKTTKKSKNRKKNRRKSLTKNKPKEELQCVDEISHHLPKNLSNEYVFL